MPEDYFARVHSVGYPDAGGIGVAVENTGAQELPVGWVRVWGTLTAADGTTVDLPTAGNQSAIAPGGFPDIVTYPTADLHDGGWSLAIQMLVTDHEGHERAADSHSSRLQITGGRANHYEGGDPIANAELGPEFGVPQRVEEVVMFDPLPYISGSALQVSLHNIGALSIPQGATVSVADTSESPDATATIDREVPANDRWSASLTLLERDPGNHDLFVRLAYPDGSSTTKQIVVCYQGSTPQEVLVY